MDKEALEERDKLFRTFFENSPDAIFIEDPYGNVLDCNPAAARLHATSRENLIGKNVSDLVPPELRKHIVLDPSRLSNAEFESLSLAADGRKIPVSIRASHIQYLGKPALLLNVRDITDRKQERDLLAASELRLRALIGSIDDIVFEFDKDGTCLDIWTANESLLVRPRGELIGRRVAEVFDAEFARPFVKAFERVLASGQAESIEYPIRSADTTSWFLARINPIPSVDGSYNTVCMLARDITDRRRAEEAIRQANEKLASRVDELQERTREITLLGEMGDLLQACVTADEAYKVFERTAQQLFAGYEGCLCVISPSQLLLEAAAVWGNTSRRAHVFAVDECWALRRGRVHSVEDTRDGLLCKHLSQPRPGAYICVPMMAQGEALGILHVSGREGGGLSKAKQQLVVATAENFALALSNLRLHETLRSHSIRDPLTGLFNRRFMEESLEREIRRAARNQRPLAVIMVDIDDFKSFNDTFGHDAGDTLLRELGTLLQSNIRGEDVACRYGGDEFTLILPESSVESGERRAEELREAIKRIELMYRNRPLGRITVSMGVASFPECGQTGATLLRTADAALYRAKSEGRDRVMIAE